MKILIAILIFSAIIIFHEFGHYIAAKLNGIRVNEFMIGLGPRLFGIQGKETMFSVHLLPFGGACVMEGEDSESEDERAFNHKPVWRRFLVVAMGPAFNFLLALVLAAVLVACTGVIRPVVNEVTEGSPAAEAGLQAGDEILRLNSYHVHFFNEIGAYMTFHKGDSVSVTVRRGSGTVRTEVTPEYSQDTGSWIIGIRGGAEIYRPGFFETIGYAFCEVGYLIYVTIMSLGMLFTGGLTLNDMSGPVGIVKTIGDAYDSSIRVSVFAAVMEMLNLTILLSANLGVMNLIPFPALDGGRLLFFIIEMIRHKKASERVEGYVNLAGFAVLMVFMVLVMGNDIRKLFM